MEEKQNNLLESFNKINFKRNFKHQKTKLFNFVNDQLSGKYKLKILKEEIRYLGIIPINCYNIESDNKNYEILLTAHYDIHFIKFSKIYTYFSNRIQCKVFNKKINIIIYVTFVIVIFFLIFLSLTCTLPLLNLAFSHFFKTISLNLKSNCFINIILILTAILTFKLTMGTIFPKDPQISDDNNSGVIGIIYLAHLLFKKGLSEKIKLVFMDKEELGLLGSKAFVNSNIEKLKDKIIINFDCIGRGEKIFFTSKNNSPIAYELKEYFISKGFNVTNSCKSYSDDKAFSNKNLNIVGIQRVNIDKRGNKLLPWIHTSDDTLDKINPNYINEVIETVADFIEEKLNKKES